jgi:DNA modification methylase
MPSRVAKRPVLLQWEGKEEALALLDAPRKSLVVEEELDADQVESEHIGRMVHGDALDVARALADEGLRGRVDLVYLDPPYLSGVDYDHEERLEGTATGPVARAVAYRDRWGEGPAGYLDMMLPRLAAMQPLLKPTGSIWIQVDWRANHLVRALCDEVFGRERFLNEIVWRRAPNLGRQARSGQFGRTLDTIIVYGAGPRARLVPPERLVPVAKGAAKLDRTTGRFFTVAPRGDYTDASIARLEKEGRVHRTAGGNVSIKYWLEKDEQGRLCKRQPIDALWIDIAPLRHARADERTGYPTQKPQALLERIVQAACPENGLVVDLFAGSGTTAAAALRLERSFVVADESAVAIATMRSRLLRDGVRKMTVERSAPPRHTQRILLEARPARAAPGTQSQRNWMEVTLRCADGPLPVAWALSRTRPRAGRFRVDWHAERGSGKRPADLPRVALLPRAASVHARVYFVDGTMGFASASLATGARAEPRSLVEAPT